MIFATVLDEETFKKLREFKDDFDRDIYYSIDYDLKNTYLPSKWGDIIKELLKINEVYWELINDKNKDLKVELRNDK